MAFLLLACAGYIAMGLYYRDGFAANTWINGIYCTGRTVAEVNAELMEGVDVPEVILVLGREDGQGAAGQEGWKLSAADIGYVLDYTDSLEAYLSRQNPWLWVENMVLHKQHAVEPSASFDEEKLRACWEGSPFCLGQGGPRDYTLSYGEQTGYALVDGISNRLDTEKAYEALRQGLAKGEDTIDLSECYETPPLTREQEETRALWEKLFRYQSGVITYDFSDECVSMDAGVLAGFLKKEEEFPYLPVLDEQGRLQLEESRVVDYVEELSAKYSTYGKEWEFQSTRGDRVTVSGVTYGGQLDKGAETQWLLETLAARLDGGSGEQPEEPHVPAYTREPFCRNSEDLGDTYIEVDMGEQKLYYYLEGELAVETDIVSGNGGGTPEGVNYVYAKQTNRILRGPGYASHVDYWMPVKGGIGIHDADWRSDFGGEIYKRGGSHGCINVPSEVMPKLYETVEIGTPVVMFY